MMRKLVVLVAIIFFHPFPKAIGQDTAENRLLLEIPALDSRFLQASITTGNAVNSLSMPQALAVTRNFHNLNYYVNNRLWNRFLPPASKRKRFWNRVFANATAGGIDLLFTYKLVVFSPQWLHEEFHRNALTLHQISSFNETYFAIQGKTPYGAVSRVTDADLIRLKRSDAPGMIRSFAAGVESEYLLIRQLQQQNFFDKVDYPNVLMNILLTNHAIGYVNQFKKRGYDNSIDSMNKYGEEMLDRDYVGWDFTPWVYDLHRPHEPYEQRGTHPSGTDIDRAIKRSRLSREEDRYLVRMGRLQYLNFISPAMLGVNRIRLNESSSFNFAVRHILNSFGYDISLDFLLDHRGRQLFASLHSYSNASLTLPGIEFGMKRVGRNKSAGFGFSPTIHLWLQPKDQLFHAKRASGGGMLRLETSYVINEHVFAYGTVETKTAGWVAGVPYLDPSLNLQLGLKLNLK